jgi:hypothetical protein
VLQTGMNDQKEQEPSQKRDSMPQSEQSVTVSEQTDRTVRPYTLTQRARKRLLGHLKRGLNQTQALKATGISRTAFANWLLADPNLVDDIETARENARSRSLRAIQRAGREDWRAHVEFLKLSFGMGKTQEQTVNVGVAVGQAPTMTEEDRLKIIAQRERSKHVQVNTDHDKPALETDR